MNGIREGYFHGDFTLSSSPILWGAPEPNSDAGTDELIEGIPWTEQSSLLLFRFLYATVRLVLFGTLIYRLGACLTLGIALAISTVAYSISKRRIIADGSQL